MISNESIAQFKRSISDFNNNVDNVGFAERCALFNDNVNFLGDACNGYYFNTNKSAKKSWKTASFNAYPMTIIHSCEMCNRLGDKRRVHVRNNVFGWNFNEDENGRTIYDGTKSIDMLCMGCWNKVRQIVKRKEDAKEIKYLKNKLSREELKWRKSQTQAI